MAYKIIKTEQSYLGKAGHPIIVAILDSADDLEALGVNYSPGSVAIVAVKDSPTYMLNASGEWKEI